MIRIGLSSLATVAGVAGLFAGGVPLAKFGLQYWQDHDYGYYYDTNSLYLPEILVVLSLSLLIFVHLGLVLGRGIPPTISTKLDSSGKPEKDSPTTADGVSPPASATGATAKTEGETPDEKLARLLTRKKD